MKITLAEIKALENSLLKIFEKEVNIKIAYKLGRFLKKINEELKTLEENRVKLVQKYGKEDEETNQVSVPSENAPKFYQEFNELMSIEIDIDFEPISLKEFGDISISAADALRFDGIILINDQTAEKE